MKSLLSKKKKKKKKKKIEVVCESNDSFVRRIRPVLPIEAIVWNVCGPHGWAYRSAGFGYTWKPSIYI